MNHATALAIALGPLLGLGACNPPAPDASTCEPVGAIHDAGERVLSVNGTEVGVKELDLVFQRLNVPEEKRKDYAWTRSGKHVAEEYALATMLYERALDEKLLENNPDLQLQLAFIERQFLSSVMREQLAKSAVTEEAIKKFYDSNRDLFEKPEVKVRQILVSSMPLAESMLDRLKNKEDFAKLAQAHSIDQASGPRGGELGWVKKGENKEFGDQVLAANKGDIVGPIESRLGFHILEVLDKRELTPLDDIRPLATIKLTNDEATRVLEEMRNNMKIEWVREPESSDPGTPGGEAGGSPHSPGGAPPGGETPPPHGNLKAPEGQTPGAPAPGTAGG